MKKQLLLLLLTFILFIAGTSFASEPPVFIRGMRPLGMGGAFIAVSDDHNAIFYNPAGLTQRTGSQITFFELPINISDDVFNFYNYYSDNKDRLEDFDDLPPNEQADIINEINDKIVTYKPNLGLGANASYLSGPGLVSWGVGGFANSDLGFQFNRSLIMPSISFWGNVDMAIMAPVAYKFKELSFLPGGISAGATLKYIKRARIAEYNKSVLEFENFDPLLQWGNGIGLDLGGMYYFNDEINIGLQISDFGGTPIKYKRVEDSDSGRVLEATTGIIRPKWNVGVAYIPKEFTYWPGRTITTNGRLTFAFDLRDIFNSEEPLYEAFFWKKIHMGAEFRWFILTLRGGFNSGYPTFGVGLHPSALSIEYAFYGDETGLYAGQIPEWNHQFSIALRFGKSKGRPYGSKLEKASSKKEKPKQEAKPAATPEPEVKDTNLTTDTTTNIETPKETTEPETKQEGTQEQQKEEKKTE